MSTKEVIRKGSCFSLGSEGKVNPWTDPWIPWLPSKAVRVKPGADISNIRTVQDLKLVDRPEWNEGLVRQVVVHEDAEALLKLSWPRVDCEEKLTWQGNSTGDFKVKDCYALLEETAGVEDVFWRKLWASNIHERLKIFLWRAMAGALPTRDVLSRRINIGDLSCPLCECMEESVDHLFTKCNWTRRLAFGSKWNLRMEVWDGKLIKDVLVEAWGSRDITPGLNMGLILCTMFYSIWLARNRVVFGTLEPWEVVIRTFEQKVEEFSEARVRWTELPIQSRVRGWNLPLSGWVVVNSDAAVKETKGAIAWVARDEFGRVLKLEAKSIMGKSIQEAELEALYWAMDRYEEGRDGKVIWRSDAKAVVEAVNSRMEPGVWETRHTLLWVRKMLETRQHRWKVVWCPRTANKLADEAARLVLREGGVLSFDVNLNLELPFKLICTANSDRGLLAPTL